VTFLAATELPKDLGFSTDIYNSDSQPDLAKLNSGRIVATFKHIVTDSESKFHTGIAILSPDGSDIIRMRDADDGSSGQRDLAGVTALTNGGFAVVWSELSSIGDFEIHTRSFDKNGKALGKEQLVFDDTHSTWGDIESLPGGGYAVVASQADGGYMQLFNNNGTLRGSVQELDNVSGFQEVKLNQIAGNWLAASNGSNGKVELFSKAGAATDKSWELTFGTSPIANLTFAKLGTNRTMAVGFDGSSIKGLVLNKAGKIIGDTIDISDSSAGISVRPEITEMKDGSVVVGWTTLNGSEPSQVFMRRIDKAGTPVGEVQTVTGNAEIDSYEVDVVGMKNGGVFVSWLSREWSGFQYDGMGQTYSTELSTNAITGNGKANKLNGTSGSDVIVAMGGGDKINGKGGDDALQGNGGKDTLLGSLGDDLLNGGVGNDTLNGGKGADTLIGENGADKMNGGKGNDLLFGGAGKDVMKGAGGNDQLEGGNGNDRLSGGNGRDRLIGGDGDDVLRGGAGKDDLRGGPGNDILFGGAGADNFRFEKDDGTATIRDFDLSEDILDIGAWFGFDLPDPDFILETYGEIDGKDTVLTHYEGSVRLVGVTDWDLLGDQIA